MITFLAMCVAYGLALYVGYHAGKYRGWAKGFEQGCALMRERQARAAMTSPQETLSRTEAEIAFLESVFEAMVCEPDLNAKTRIH